MTQISAQIAERAVNAIRALTLDATSAAGEGHPGMPLGCAPMAYTLWQNFLNHNPQNSAWFNRDRFVQSAGHGSMLSYSLLHLTGYDLSMEEIKRHRQLHSKTPGHPEVGHTHGVEMTTGPLGQGISTAVGMALAEAHLAARFNRPDYPIIDHYTYVIASDGDLMEGISAEASSLAGHLELKKLIVLYDDNHVTIDGKTDQSFTEDVLKRYEAYHWHTQRVTDGNDIGAIAAAIEAAKMTDKPSLIAIRTIIGYGTPIADTSDVHGKALKGEQLAASKVMMGVDWEAFSVPSDVRAHYGEGVARAQTHYQAHQALWQSYQKAHPEAAAELSAMLEGRYKSLPQLNFPVGKDDATRNWSHKVINDYASFVPALVGGSADLAGSNKTTMKQSGFMSAQDYSPRNIHFGVREHAMGAMANGMSLHGGLRPYVATFLIFSDYLRASIRLAALMKQPVIYVFTHDSIGVGGDGPTHQPIEQLTSLRAIPNLTVIRPADPNETGQAWAYALASKDSPTALILTRQTVPTLELPQDGVAKGGYIVADSPDAQVILLASGSELALALEAREGLEPHIPTRVISMPSSNIFDKQSLDYQESVLPKNIRKRIAIEAGASLGWHKYTGLDGKVIGVDDFGASGDEKALFELFGITVENIIKTAQSL
ncbi:MAG: transketolase [Deinococcales bacterium]